MVVGLPLVFEGEPAIGDVVEVLQPFKVGDGDTSGVDVHVGDDQATVGLEDLVSTRGHRPVCCLGNNLRLDPVGVATVDHLLHGGGHRRAQGCRMPRT